MLESSDDVGRKVGVARWLFTLPLDLDPPTRARIIKLLEADYRNHYIVENLPETAPQLDPPNGIKFSAFILNQLISDVSTSTEPYSLDDEDPIENVASALPDVRFLAGMLAHPGCVGEYREALLKRFEELVLYGGQHVFLPWPKKDDNDNEDENATTDKVAPVVPERQFRTIHDASEWIRKNWPDFDLEQVPEIEYR